MIGINRDDGVLVLKFIEEQLGQKMPQSGILAGQSVASVLLYLKKKSLTINVNDYDIFVPRARRGKSWDFIPHTRSEDKLKTEMDIIRLDKFMPINQYGKIKKGINELIKEKEARKEHLMYEDDDYIDISKLKISSLYRKENFVDFKERINYSSYKIEQTFRKGLLNYVYIVSSLNSYRELNPMNIINNFDINCTQVAINLRTKEIYYTTNFIYFLNSMEMILLKTNKPHHSFIRFMKKKEEHGYYGNNEYASMVCNTLSELKSDKSQRFFMDLELNRSNNDYENYKLNHEKAFAFGKGYIEKYKSTKEIRDFCTLKTKLVKINKIMGKNEEGETRDLSYLGDKYRLGELSFRDDASKYIMSGQHFKEMQKKLGMKIIGYRHYVNNNVENILMKEFKIGSMKQHERRFNYIKGRKLNTRTKFGYLDNKILDMDHSHFKGSVDRKNIDKINEMIYENPDIKSYFEGKTIEDMFKTYTLLNSVKKKNIGMFFFLEAVRDINLDSYKSGNDLLSDIQEKYDEYLENISKLNKIKDDRDIPVYEIDGYKCFELTTQGELDEESKVQINCIRTYASKIKNRDSFIVSIRNNKNLFERCTLEIKYSRITNKYIEQQYRKRRNKKPSEKMKNIKNELIERINKDLIN